MKYYSIVQMGLHDCDCRDHQDLKEVHNLVPMSWEEKSGDGILPWIPESGKSSVSSLAGAISEMSKLRTETPSIYVKSMSKDSKSVVR